MKIPPSTANPSHAHVAPLPQVCSCATTNNMAPPLCFIAGQTFVGVLQEPAYISHCDRYTPTRHRGQRTSGTREWQRSPVRTYGTSTCVATVPTPALSSDADVARIDIIAPVVEFAFDHRGWSDSMKHACEIMTNHNEAISIERLEHSAGLQAREY